MIEPSTTPTTPMTRERQTNELFHRTSKPNDSKSYQSQHCHSEADGDIVKALCAYSWKHRFTFTTPRTTSPTTSHSQLFKSWGPFDATTSSSTLRPGSGSGNCSQTGSRSKSTGSGFGLGSGCTPVSIVKSMMRALDVKSFNITHQNHSERPSPNANMCIAIELSQNRKMKNRNESVRSLKGGFGSQLPPRCQKVLCHKELLVMIFRMPAGSRMPLHNHQEMAVFSHVLQGSLRVKEYQWLDERKGLARLDFDEVLEAGKCDARFIGPAFHNLHSFQALTDCVILDIITPAYSDERPPKFYLPTPKCTETSNDLFNMNVAPDIPYKSASPSLKRSERRNTLHKPNVDIPCKSASPNTKRRRLGPSANDPRKTYTKEHKCYDHHNIDSALPAINNANENLFMLTEYYPIDYECREEPYLGPRVRLSDFAEE